MKKQKLNFVSADDWAGLYIDDKLALEGHSLHWSHVLDALGVSYEADVVDEEWIETQGRLPKNFKDVKI